MIGINLQEFRLRVIISSTHAHAERGSNKMNTAETMKFVILFCFVSFRMAWADFGLESDSMPTGSLSGQILPHSADCWVTALEHENGRYFSVRSKDGSYFFPRLPCGQYDIAVEPDSGKFPVIMGLSLDGYNGIIDTQDEDIVRNIATHLVPKSYQQHFLRKREMLEDPIISSTFRDNVTTASLNVYNQATPWVYPKHSDAVTLFTQNRLVHSLFGNSQKIAAFCVVTEDVTTDYYYKTIREGSHSQTTQMRVNSPRARMRRYCDILYFNKDNGQWLLSERRFGNAWINGLLAEHGELPDLILKKNKLFTAHKVRSGSVTHIETIDLSEFGQ